MYLLLPLITLSWDSETLAGEQGLSKEKPHPSVTSQVTYGAGLQTGHLATTQLRPGQASCGLQASITTWEDDGLLGTPNYRGSRVKTKDFVQVVAGMRPFSLTSN
jgi:hypothetical protein